MKRSNDGPPCPICRKPRLASTYVTTRQGRGRRRYVHTTCGDPGCKSKERSRQSALKYLKG